MNKKDQAYQTIHEYLHGTLSHEERLSFESSLENDADLRALFEDEKAFHHTILYSAIPDIKTELKEEFNTQKKAQKVKKLIKVSSLGAIALLVTGSIIYSNQTSKKTIEEVTSTSTPQVVQKEKAVNYQPEVEEPKVEMGTNSKTTITQSEPEKKIASEALEIQIITDSIHEEVLKNELKTVEVAPKVHESKSEANNESQGLIDYCKNKKIDFSLSSSSTCKKKNQGSIFITMKTPGENYLYDLSGKTISEISSFHALAPGKYTVQVADETGCLSAVKSITVKEKSCSKEAKSFNPAFGDFIYNSKNKIVTLKILNTLGQIVYEIADKNPSWDGKHNNGQLLPQDSYLYLIYDKDQLIDQNYITLIR